MDAEVEYLEISWSRDDGDGIGRLTVRAAANAFSGTSQAWFNRESIEEFADALFQYPLDPGRPPSIDGGLGDETHVALKVYPVGSFGQVAFGVDLATEFSPDDRVAAQHRVRLELPTTCERLGGFARELRQITEHNGRSARIDAERLAL